MSFSGAAASDFDSAVVVKVLEAELLGVVGFVLIDAIAPTGRIASCPTRPITVCLRSDAVQRPQRLEAALRNIGSIISPVRRRQMAGTGG